MPKCFSFEVIFDFVKFFIMEPWKQQFHFMFWLEVTISFNALKKDSEST